MTFYQSISNYVLGNISTQQLPQIALAGLEEKLASEALTILAGMDEQDNHFEILAYYTTALEELKIKAPDKKEAAKVLLQFYLRQMSKSPEKVFSIMVVIDNQIQNRIDENSAPQKKPKYVGESLGLQTLYTWYREIQDWIDGDRLSYYKELTRAEQRIKFEEHLLEEAKILLKKLEAQ